MKIKNEVLTYLWDAVKHLETEEDMVAYLEAAIEENDPILIAAGLGDIKIAIGLAQISGDSSNKTP